MDVTNNFIDLINKNIINITSVDYTDFLNTCRVNDPIYIELKNIGNEFKKISSSMSDSEHNENIIKILKLFSEVSIIALIQKNIIDEYKKKESDDEMIKKAKESFNEIVTSLGKNLIIQ